MHSQIFKTPKLTLLGGGDLALNQHCLSTVIVAYGGHPEECAGTAVAVLMSYTNLPSLTVSLKALVLLYLAHRPLSLMSHWQPDLDGNVRGPQGGGTARVA